MPPLVSIIIPCFNADRFVADAIRSALNQTYSNREVIVVDDGSRDNSLAVIRSFEPNVEWISGPNQGGAAARNAGLELARGEFIQFLDADDLLEARKLEEQLSTLLATGADVVYSDWVQYPFGDPAKAEFSFVPQESDDSVITTLHPQNIQTQSTLHRKAALAAVGGFRKELPCCQERDLHLRMACAGAVFRRHPKVLHTTRSVSGSVSANEIRVLRVLEGIISEAFDHLKTTGRMTSQRAKAFARLTAVQGRRWLIHGDVMNAERCFQNARQMHTLGGIPDAYGRTERFALRFLGFAKTEQVCARIRTLKRVIKHAIRTATSPSGTISAQTLQTGIATNQRSVP